MRDYINSFLAYLRIEKIASPLTIYDYNKELLRFSSFLRSLDIADINLISTRIIRQYFYHAKEERVLGPATVSKIIAIIKSFFNYLEEDEIIIKNPSRKIKVPKKINKIPSVMSKYEVDLIIRSVDFAPSRCRRNAIRDRLILSLLYYSGIRRNELLSLNWSDFNLEKSTMIIRSGKGGRDRLIPLHSSVTKLLDSYLEERLPLKDNALIIGESGRRMCKCSFVIFLNMYLKISGLKKKGYTAHSFRHSFATRLTEKNVNILLVQRLLSHLSLDSTKIYVHFESKNYRNVIDYI